MITGKIRLSKVRWFGLAKFRLFGVGAGVELDDGRCCEVRRYALRRAWEVVDEGGAVLGKSRWSVKGYRFYDAEGELIDGVEIAGSVRFAPAAKLRLGDEEVSVRLELVGGRREFGTGDMHFWHHDYQSHLNFRAPEELVVPAMMVAFFAYGDTRQK